MSDNAAYFLVCLFLSFTAIVNAQPANNTCTTAQVIVPDGTCYPGTTDGATDMWSGTVGCQQSGGSHPDVWYTFVATSAAIDVNVTGGTLTSGMAFILVSGVCGGTFTLVGSLCGGPNITGQLDGLTPGEAYIFTVSGRNTTGTFSVCVQSLPPPPNDDPCGAIALPVGGTCNYATYTNFGATATAGVPAPGCANYKGGDVWFSVTVPLNGNLTINSIQGTMTDGAMAAYSATSCAGPFTLIQCDDDGSENGLMPKLVLTGRTPGETIWIRFWEYGNNNNGTFGICAVSPVSNNTCSTAQPITPDGTCFGGTTAGATDMWTGTVGCQSGDGHPDVWYSFTATGTQFDYNISAGGAIGNIELILAQGTCASTFTIIGSRCGPPVLTGSISGLVVGQTYYFTISSSGTPGPFTACIGNSTPPPVPGQDCSQPQILCNGNSTWHESPSGIGTTAEDISTNTCFSANESNSKWFRLTIGCSGTLGFRIEPDNSSDDYDWIVWNTPCAGVMGAAIACNWLTSSGGTGLNSNYLSETNGTSPWYNSTAANYNLLNVTAGQTLTLLVNRYSGTSPGFTLSFEGTAVIGPDPEFSMSSSNCGESVTVQATCGPAINNFDWTFGDGNGGSGAGPLTHNYAEANAYNIGLTVTDMFNCSASSSKTMEEELDVTEDITNVTCNGGSDGSISLTVNNGTGPYSFDWVFGGSTATVTGLTAGAYDVQITDNGGRCVYKTYEVTEPEPFTTPDAGIDQSICRDSTGLSANIPDNGTGVWSVVAGSAVFENINDPNTIVENLSPGENILRWTINDGTCPGLSDEVSIFVTVPVNANAGPDQDVCGITATLAGNNPSPGTGLWTVISGSATFTDNTLFNTTVTALGAGTNTLRWTISNGVCGSTFDEVNINATLVAPASNAGVDQDVCGTTATLAGNNPSPGTGLWTVISGSATFTDNTLFNTTVTALGAGTNTLRWTISNGVCGSTFDEVNINITLVAPASNAGVDQDVCGTTATLAGNNPSPGTGLWTVISGSATFTDNTLFNTTVTALGAGTNTLRWTISNGVCGSTFDEVDINSTPTAPAANAGGDQNICGTTATLAGNNPSPGTGLWTLVSGSATFTDNNLFNTTVSALGAGANVFRWTISNGICTASSDDVTITRDLPPTAADAGTDQTVCASTATLAGNIPVTGTGAWIVISGGATVTTPSDPSSGVTGLGAGANVFRWTISNGICTASSDDVTITRDLPPTVADAGPDQSVCINNVVLAANAASVGSGAWSVFSGNGTFTNPLSPSTEVTDLGVGLNIFRWTISSGSCGSSSSDVNVIFSSGPVANAGTDAYICQGGSASLNASGGNLYSWSPATGLSNPNISNPSASPSVTTVYTVVVSDFNGCQDTDQVTVYVSCFQISDAPDSLCSGQIFEIPFTVSGSFSSGNIFTAQLSDASGNFSSPVNIGSLQAITSGVISCSLPSWVTGGSAYRIRLISSAPSLISPVNGTDIYIEQVPSAPVISASSMSVCEGQNPVLSVPAVYGYYQWIRNDVKITNGNSNQYLAVIDGLYKVEAGMNGAGCKAVSAPVNINLTANLNAPLITSLGAPKDTLLTSSSASGYQWYVNNRLIVGAEQRNLSTRYNGAYKVSVVYIDGCRMVSDIHTINHPDYVDIGRAGFPMTDSTIIMERKDIRLAIFPNPSFGNFTIVSEEALSGELVIIDMMGNTRHSESLRGKENTFTVSMEGLSAGIYNLCITSGGRRWNYKITLIR